jgi:hypothetical protein
MSKAPKLEVDPQTARCLRELRATIDAIEAGEVALRLFEDRLVEENGMHRTIALRVTFLPKAK